MGRLHQSFFCSCRLSSLKRRIEAYCLLAACGKPMQQPAVDGPMGWCELVSAFGQVNWKNVGQLVATN
jgi:hypothetical protein